MVMWSHRVGESDIDWAKEYPGRGNLYASLGGHMGTHTCKTPPSCKLEICACDISDCMHFTPPLKHSVIT